MTSRESMEKIKSILHSHNLPYATLKEMLNQWAKFIDHVAEFGYSDWEVEYDFDIWIRHEIDKVLAIEALWEFEEFHLFKTMLPEIDERLKPLFLPGVTRGRRVDWWDAGIIRKGTGDYAADIKLSYGIDIPPI